MKRIVLVVISLLFFSQAPVWAQYENEIEQTKSSQKLIGLAEAHAMGFTGKGQTIVIFDTGVQIDHPYLKDALIGGYCSSKLLCGVNYGISSIAAGAVVQIPGLAGSGNSHGSMASGIALGRAVGNIPGGIAPGANLISINNEEGQSEGIIKALDWVLSVKDEFNIVAVSASIAAPNSGLRNQPGSCLPFEIEIRNKVRKLAEANIAFVVATGNDGFTNNISFPACLPDAISVGAVDSKGDIAGYSNIAENMNLLAPADVIGANSSTGFFVGQGTSSATPVVAGAIAILRQVKPSATLDEIRKALATTTKFKNDFIWKNIPMLDLPSAIRALQAGEFSKVKISGTVETVDTTKQELAEVLAGAKLLNIEMARMTKKIKDLEDLQVGSESKLSEAKLALLALQNESKANLELIAKLQSDLKSGNELIANLEAASKATTITCVKGKLSKKVTAIKPKCPTGYKKKV
jgi:hypothetical protein